MTTATLAAKITETETRLRRLRSAVFDVPPEQEAAHAEEIAKAKRRLLRLRRLAK